MHRFTPDFFKRLFDTLDNNSVLMRVEPDGKYYPVWCSDEFCQMMEGPEEDFIRLENGGTMSSVHPDDREQVAYLFRNRHAPDGSNSLTIRKTTLKGNLLWVTIHYAFIEEAGDLYAYCSYFDVTELKESQRQTEDVYENMLNQFNAMADESLTVFRTNLTKGIIEDVRGYDLYPTDFAGGSIAESARIRAASFLVPGDNDRYNEIFALEKLLARYYNGEGPATFVGYCRRHSGRQCFVKFSGTARKNPDTGDVTAFGIETEYNNQHVSEVLNNKVLSKQYDMVCYIVDGNYGVVIGDEANIKRGSIFPHERSGSYADYLSKQVFPAIHGTDEERAALCEALKPEQIKKALENQEVYTVDVACDISGEMFNKRFTFYAVDREAQFYILLKSDVTEILNERESNAILHKTLGSGPWSMDFDEAGTMTSVTWTEPFRQMLGYESEADFPNRLESWSDLLHEEDKERVLSEFNGTIADYTGKKSYDVEYRLLTKDRGWRWFHTMGRLRRRADGTPVTYVGMFVDITERKEMEAQLEAQQRSLKDALTEAKHANAAKTSFLSNMSHDIRTPMNAIIGFTNLAMQHTDDRAKITEYLGKIQVSSNHLLSLINDVLEMSRIESGKIELDEQPCNLPDILHDLNTIIIAQVESKQQELHMDALNVMNENIMCDRLRLNQVLLNLLSNAVKYTPSGGKISVRVAQLGEPARKDGGDAVFAPYEIRVKDNGIGMSDEFAKHVFEAFEREKTSTVSGIQGTGLGMAITKKIIDLMGGTIHVMTEKGKGSEFIVRLELRIKDGGVPEPKIVELTDMHALVVDDDFDTCDSTSRMLTSLGMRADWTLSGKEAVLRAKQAKEVGDSYGVFIVDWRLSDLNGIEVARRIRDSLGEDAPILLMTAYDWPAIKGDAEDAGVRGFCNKPLFLSELRQALERALGGARETTAESSPKAEEAPQDFGGKRLLLVDDMDVNREIACAVLEMHGFEMEQAENGQDALHKVSSAPAGYYDAILMDIQMPIMNGYEATRAIRALADEKKRSVPIIAMTANAFDEDRKNALDAGMNAHIAKPIDERKVVEVLSKILGGGAGNAFIV